MIELVKNFLIGIGINVLEWQTILFLGFSFLIVVLMLRR